MQLDVNVQVICFSSSSVMCEWFSEWLAQLYVTGAASHEAAHVRGAVKTLGDS